MSNISFITVTVNKENQLAYEAHLQSLNKKLAKVEGFENIEVIKKYANALITPTCADGVQLQHFLL